MTGAKKLTHVSVEEYLLGEKSSAIKHEYLSGAVYAMVGARNAHNIIAGNIFASLWGKLSASTCRPFNSDTKIRLRIQSEIRFYYPDVSVVCRQNSQRDLFQDEPVVVVEVLSRSTRRIDEGEKKDAYLTIPSLATYILVEQESPAVVAWRLSENGFQREEHQGLDAVIRLDEIEAVLPLSEIYHGVEFSPESAPPDLSDREQ